MGGMVATSEKKVGNASVLSPTGRIDVETTPPLQERLLPLLGQAGAAVVIDFTGVTYISSSGLRALMLGAKEAKAKGGKLAVCALNETVSEIFRISRFNQVVPVYPDLSGALTAVAPPAGA